MKDDFITISQLKNKVKEFCQVRDWNKFHTAKDLAIGIVTEASELLEIFRFKNEKEEMEILSKKRGEIKEEIADIFYFILRFSEKYGIDLSSALMEKLKINEERYPVNIFRGKNKKYDEL